MRFFTSVLTHWGIFMRELCSYLENITKKGFKPMYKIKEYMNRQQDIVKELITVIDLFRSNRIDHVKFEEIVHTYMNDYFELLVKKIDSETVQVNSAAYLKLGKKRLFMISKCLEKKKFAKLSNVDDGLFTVMKEEQLIS